MLSTQGLLQLLELQPASSAPSLTIFAARLTPRLRYVCNFIFSHVLHVQAQLTSDRETFIKLEGMKICYGEQLPADCLFVPAAGLLEQKGVDPTFGSLSLKDRDFIFEQHEGLKSPGPMEFDVFSAVFYFISRYEEYLPFESDRHGRFEAVSSILSRAGKLRLPVVDQWLLLLRSKLQLMYPSVQFPAMTMRVVSTLDIDNLFAYKHKGFLRTGGAILRDLLKADLRTLKDRLSALRGAKDPFDIYDEVGDFCFEHRIPLFVFFLMRSNTSFDRSVPPGQKAFAEVFRRLLLNQAVIGLHPSYYSSAEPDLLEKELKQIRHHLGHEVYSSRQHYLRFDIRRTPAQLLASGLRVDFSMGFASAAGYRAGTAYPFYYYGFEAEKQADLLFVPFCAMDGVYTVYGQGRAAEAEKEILQMAETQKLTGGLFCTVFHERTFYDHLYPGFGSLYKNLHLKLKDQTRA